MTETAPLGFWLALLALLCLVRSVRPGPARGLDPAQCLVSGNHELTRPPEVKGEARCRQDCVADPDCHMAVVSTPWRGSAHCLLVHCLDRSQSRSRPSRPRDPSASIAVYPKSSDEVRRCGLVVDVTSSSACRLGTPRFFYNSSSSRCQRLLAGCGSEGNSFSSPEGCEALCRQTYLCYRPLQRGERPPGPARPHAPPSTEVLPHNFFFYNVSSGRCEGFHFRGSASTGNIFTSVERCEGLCGGVGGNYEDH
ncbi:Protein AMBP [Liparis tanakae]|uniref:Protein AMBP n=1 Tax=Liparis tanakae TaxID=230148 RepID=A0A4Z2ERU3_9TELE|nr:Protein AMBP [Liparis tanakae]